MTAKKRAKKPTKKPTKKRAKKRTAQFRFEVDSYGLIESRKRGLFRDKYPALNQALSLVRRLTVAELLVLRDVVGNPTDLHINYVKRGLKKQRLDTFYRTVDPNAPVELPSEHRESIYGRFVGRKWRPYSKEMIEKHTRPITISDEPIPT